MTEFEKQAVLISIKNMFMGGHFSICTVDKCLAITGCIPPRADYNALNAVHCVNFSDMPKAFRDQLFVKTLELFNHSGFPLEEIMILAASNKLRVLQ